MQRRRRRQLPSSTRSTVTVTLKCRQDHELSRHLLLQGKTESNIILVYNNDFTPWLDHTQKQITTLENMEISRNSLILENSGNLKYSQWILVYQMLYFSWRNLKRTTSQQLSFCGYSWTYVTMLLKNLFFNSATKVPEMTAKVICYIAFSLYNCMEKTVYRIWKTSGISFFQICKHTESLGWFTGFITVILGRLFVNLATMLYNYIL